MSAKDNIDKLSSRVAELTNENLNLRTESEFKIDEVEKFKIQAKKETLRADEAEDKISDIEKKRANSSSNDRSTIAGEMLKKVLKLENEANKFKYKSD